MANTRLVRYIESIGGVASSSELKASGFSAGAIAYALETGLADGDNARRKHGKVLRRGALHRRPPQAKKNRRSRKEVWQFHHFTIIRHVM